MIRTFQADNPETDVFVVGVDDDASLFHLASRFGTCLNARIMRSRDSGQSRGFGFIRMATAIEAKAAVRGLEGLKEGSRTLHARPVDERHVSGITRAKETKPWHT
jgi:RNA recognition motif-containing protein